MNTILKNFLYLVVGKYTAAGIGLIGNVLVARTIGVEGMGNWTAAMAAATLCAAFLDLGFNRILVKEGAADLKRVDTHLFNILISKGVLSVIVLAGVHFYAVRNGWMSPMYKLILLLTLCKMADNFNMTFDKVFQIFQRMEFSAIILACGRILLLIAVCFGWVTEANVLFFGWIYLLISLSTSIVTLLLSSLKFAKPRRGAISIWGTLGRESIFFAISALVFQAVVTLDALILNENMDKATVGYYGVVQRCMWAFHMLPQLVETSILPVIFNLGRNHRDRLAAFYSTYMNRSLILGLFPFLWGLFFPTALVSVFGAEFLPAAQWLPWMVPVLLFRFIMMAAGNVLTAVDRQWERTIYSIIWCIVTVTLLWQLVPEQGIKGCLAALVGGHALMAVICVVAVSRLGYKLTLPPLVRTGLAGLLGAGALHLVTRVLPASLTIGVVGCLVTLAITSIIVMASLLAVQATSLSEMRSFLRPRPE
ncbi:MAG: oligosaccharide flippase family protein [bacterium]|nr:oligosaccharide flippase family protein [bacterium]